MVKPHPDQEDDEIAVDVRRVTTSLDLHSHSLLSDVTPISMDQERRLPPQADPALPAGDSPQAAISLFPRYGLGSP